MADMDVQAPAVAEIQAPTLARELGHSLVLLALTGMSIGCVMVIVALAARSLGR